TSSSRGLPATGANPFRHPERSSPAGGASAGLFFIAAPGRTSHDGVSMNRLRLSAAAMLFALAMMSGATAIAAVPDKPAGDSTSARSGVWYEIFVRSWYDTDGDGIGDLDGVTAKLDYLRKLGVSGIWLMPNNPSPSYHGYDVTYYKA